MRHLLISVLLCLLAGPAAAQQAPDFERDVLGDFHSSPTRVWLDETYPDVRERLEAAATNPSHTIYVRHRAITLTSRYADVRTRSFLVGLLTDGDPEIRRMAVYTLGRAFGRQADAMLVARLAAVIEQDPGVVAEWAVRALRWVHHDDALRLLRVVANGTHERLAELAAGALRESVMLVSAQ